MRALFVLSLLCFIPLPARSCFPHSGSERFRNRPRSGAGAQPLVHHERVPPNTPELHPRASGARHGRIMAGTPEFDKLSRSYNPDVVYLDEEGTGEDRIMTKRAREKLDNLALLVTHDWPNVRVRVTEAFDTTGNHAPDSLHYEGRALDITTDDHDFRKYGHLARLADRAGFDFIFYESRTHIHVSVRSDDAADRTRLRGCFPNEAEIISPSGAVPMSSLKVGDRVLAVDRTSGRLHFTDVLMFGHHDKDEYFTYLRITAANSTLEITPNHLIPVYASSSRTPSFTYAANVKVGDVIGTVADGREIRPSPVTAISTVRLRGIHAPISRSGTLLVNGVFASAYAEFRNEPLAHAALLPVRLLSSLGFRFAQTSDVHWYLRILAAVADAFFHFEFF